MAQRLGTFYPEAQITKFEARLVPSLWDCCHAFIFIMATGIVVRTIAPLIRDKKTDPAVIVLDEKGEFAISLLSGHLGGANKMAKEIAEFMEGEAVITTASDVNGVISIDLWAAKNGFIIENCHLVPQIATKLLNNGTLQVYSVVEVEMPHEFLKVAELELADILITNKTSDRKDQLCLRPKNLTIGIGCHPGTTAEEIENAVLKIFHEYGLSFSSVCCLSTINLRANEPGLITLGQKYQLSITAFTPEELNCVVGIPQSLIVFKATGAYAVAEPAAMLASGMSGLLVHKQKIGNVTVAVAEGRRQGSVGAILPEVLPHCSCPPAFSGKIYIVGTGPGSIKHLTPYARDSIIQSEVIIGYGHYLSLIQELIKDKATFSTGMTHEIDRCNKAIDEASFGKIVAVISGGDAGIYGMAGLVFELIRARSTKHERQKIDIEVIPGISSLNACASKLGAPLMHDFACISLSDRLTPWELIEKRLEAATQADFVIVLYNPKSKHRVMQISRAREIILKYRDAETPVGIVTAAMRRDEKVVISNLQNMLDHEIDMQTTIIIGNSKTFLWQDWMITPRGYENKQSYYPPYTIPALSKS
ncbi:MAG: precorrin-3B C(17)-methyltransferase [Candidatus Desantisbacteria bacterium]